MHVQFFGIDLIEGVKNGNALVEHRFIDGKSRFIGKDAGRETRDTLFHFELQTSAKNIVIDGHVVSKKVQFGSHVSEQSTNTCCQMDDMGRLMLRKDGFGGSPISQVSFFG